MSKHLPDGWRNILLENLCEICYGKDQKMIASPSGKYDILGTGGIIGKSNSFLYDQPSVLIGRKGTIDKPQYVKRPFWTVDTLFYTKIIHECSSKWLFYFLSNIDLTKYNEATGVPSLSREALNNIQLHVPPLSEQRKIAEILSAADRSIEATEKLIAKLADLKKALMQQLLTQGIGHTEFKSSPLGKIPKEWNVVELGQLIEKLEAGVSVNSEDRNVKTREIGVMKTSCVNGGIFNPSEHKTIIAEDTSRASCNLRKNSILISRMNTPVLVGENAYIDRDYNNLFLPDRLWQIVMSPKVAVSVKWLSYILQSTWMKDAISGIATGTSGSMKNISKPVFLGLETVFPPLTEQRKIADILSGVDRKLGAAKAKLAKAKDLKQGLMNDLLTGKVRVRV